MPDTYLDRVDGPREVRPVAVVADQALMVEVQILGRYHAMGLPVESSNEEGHTLTDNQRSGAVKPPRSVPHGTQESRWFKAGSLL